jgi:DNA-binding transcriptional LysR family regulator
LSQHYAEKGHIFEDFNMLATAVIAGHGIALCPVDVFRREIANGDLLELSDLCVRESLHYYLFRSCTSARSVQEFSDWFAGVCRVAKDPPEYPLLSSAV